MSHLKPGTKVKYTGYGKDTFPEVYTVESYCDDACGEGCCEAYVLAEIPHLMFRPDDIKEVKND